MDGITLMASGNRMGRGRIKAITRGDATVGTAFPAHVGEILFLTGVFDTIVAKVACRVVAAGPEGLELRFVAMTQETNEALARFILQRERDAAKPLRNRRPRFKVLITGGISREWG